MSAKPLTTVTVIGLGPAGQIAAHRAAAHGAEVRAFDPTGGRLPSTIGLWEHQLPAWAPKSLVKVRFQPQVVLYDGTRLTLNATYCIVDNSALAELAGYTLVKKPYKSRSDAADLVIDARGSGSKVPFRQIAYGQVFAEGDVPNAVRQSVLMDFRCPPDQPAGSFSYRVPLGEGKWLVEETILATEIGPGKVFGSVAQATDWLRERQLLRLGELGINPRRALSEEFVDFPLVPHKRPSALQVWGAKRRGRPIPFGQLGGWMHPATGYSVGFVAADVDRFLSSRGCSPRGGVALWALRRRGLAALLSFSPQQQAEFFSAFFRLPQSRVFDYLTGDSVPKTLKAMASVAVPLAKTNPKTLTQLVSGFCFGGKTVGNFRRRISRNEPTSYD